MSGTLTLSGNSNTLQQVPADSFQATVEGVQSTDPTPSTPLIINWSDIVGKPTFGTAASRDVPASGDAATNQVVLGSDTRLTDSRNTTPAQIIGSTNLGRDLLTAATTTNAQAVLGATALGQALFTAATQLDARNSLGLGTASTLNSPIPVANGGTGSTTASGARTNLGLAIGTDVQAQDTELQAIAGLTSAADKLPYFTGSGTAALTDLTSAARSVLDDTTVAAMRTTLGVSWETLSDTVPTAVSEITLSIPSSGYIAFRVHFVNILCASSGASNDLFLRVSEGGSILIGASDYYDFSVDWTSSAGTIRNAVQSFIPLMVGGNAATPEGFHGFIEFGPGAASVRSLFVGQTKYLNNAGSRCIKIIGSEVLTSTARVDRIQFGWAGGSNFSNGVGHIVLEGLRG